MNAAILTDPKPMTCGDAKKTLLYHQYYKKEETLGSIKAAG